MILFCRNSNFRESACLCILRIRDKYRNKKIAVQLLPTEAAIQRFYLKERDGLKAILSRFHFEQPD